MTQGFHILAYSTFLPRLSNLPSKAPDWTDHSSLDRLALPQKGVQDSRSQHTERVYSASGDSIPEVQFGDSTRTMIVKGFLCNTISFAATPPKEWPDGMVISYNLLESGLTIEEAQLKDEGGVYGSIINRGKWLHEWPTSQVGVPANQTVVDLWRKLDV